MKARRALLYVPGSDWHKMEKAAVSGVDSVCLDLEDGVAPNRKVEARQLVVRALNELNFGKSERLVRANAADSGLVNEDLEAVLALQPDGIVMPKVASGEQVRTISAKIGLAEQAQKLHKNSIALLAQIESAIGLVNIKEIAGADERLDALIFGAEDFAGDVGAKRTIEGAEVFYARSAVVTHAAAFGLMAIDMLWVDFKDHAGLKRMAEQGAGLGFSGTQIIHPEQIKPAQLAFTPTAKEIEAAKRLVDTFEQNSNEGRGAFAMDGKMVDMPMVVSARRILARASLE
jgi:citrate lyase beta subunit